MPGFSDYLEGKLLDHVFRHTTGTPATYTSPSTRAVRLHIGPPGESGTGNPAAQDSRVVVTFAAASSGSISSNAQVQWLDYAISGIGTTETITHWSVWDATSGGNCLATGPLGNVAPFAASASAGTFTAQAHGLSVGHKVEVYPLPGGTIPSGLAINTSYTVATVPSVNTFTLTGVTASGTCVVQPFTSQLVNHGDTITIASGSLTIYGD